MGDIMYKYDLHMHTIEASACGQSDVHAMIRRLHSAGFSGAVITNHFLGGNTAIDRSLPWQDIVQAFSAPYYDGQTTARELGFDLLFGLEQGYGKGKEFLVYGLTPQFLFERPELRDCSLELWSDEVRRAGGFLCYAHPFRNRSYILNPDEMPDLSLCDGVEAYNYCNEPEENEKAFAVFSGKNTVLLAGGDHHSDRLTDSYGIALSKPVHTERELADRLRNGDFSLYLG